MLRKIQLIQICEGCQSLQRSVLRQRGSLSLEELLQVTIRKNQELSTTGMISDQQDSNSIASPSTPKYLLLCCLIITAPQHTMVFINTDFIWVSFKVLLGSRLFINSFVLMKTLFTIDVRCSPQWSDAYSFQLFSLIMGFGKVLPC